MAEICKDLLKVENVNDEIENLETLLELTKNYCLSKEFQSVHYNLSDAGAFLLSKERNHYINMLSITLDKLDKIKNINNDLMN